MTTTPDQAHRVAVTFPVAGETLDVDAAISVFHRWIREGCALEGLLIDVADYRHVPDGPGVLLIGLDRDRSIEFSTGEVAIRSMSKRPLADDLTGHVRAVAHDALVLAAGLAEPDAFGDTARIDLGGCRVTVLDRLRSTNDAAGAATVEPAVREALEGLEPGEIVREISDPRGPLSLRVALGAGGDPAALAERLTASATRG